ncbi:MAG TPA: acyltransferase [Streptosporangiaceae bacterium]|nr:acyltransferase [Streptosporangiaceae bacterium]
MAVTRAPAEPGHQNALDGLRAVAALAVLAFHVGGQTGITFQGTLGGRLGSRADVAVAIFFVLSGLLLYRPWARATLAGATGGEGGAGGPSTWTYLWRRALRILPLYWLLVAVALIAYSPGHLDSPVTWLRWLTLTQIYDLTPWWELPGPHGLAHVWSLSTEVAFYLLLPLLAAALAAYARLGEGRRDRRRRDQMRGDRMRGDRMRGAPAGDRDDDRDDVARRGRRLLIGLAALSLISPAFNAWVTLTHQNFQLYLWLPRSLWWFTAGMAIAVLREWARLRPGRVRTFCQTLAASPGTAWLTAVGAYAVACTDAGGPVIPSSLRIPIWENEARLALYLVVAACLVAPAAFQPANETFVSWLFGNGAMRFLGRISYGIFLWQFVVIYGYYDLFDLRPLTFDYFPVLIVTSLGTIVLAAASYYVVEKPLMRLRHAPRLSRPAPPVEPVPQTPIIQWHTNAP